MRFTKYLETITHAKNLPARICKLDHTLHHGAEPGDCTATEIVTIRKPAGQYDAVLCIEFAKVLILMPQHAYFLAKIMCKRIIHVPVTIGTWKNNDTKFHSC